MAADVERAARGEDLSGAEKAAILVMYLERDVARTVLRHLDDAELQQLGLAIAAVQDVREEVVDRVVGEFVAGLQEVAMIGRTGRDFARDVLPELVDAPRRAALAGAIRRRVGSDFEAFVRARSPQAVAAVLAEEHPQVQAVALLRMGADNAARVLALMDEDAQCDLALRMARAERVSGEMADDVEASIRHALEDRDDPLPLGGAQVTARILGRLPRERNAQLLARIRESSADLAQTLQQLMVTFEDLDALDDRGIQTLLRAVERPSLVLALKGASPALRDRFLKNLSSRAAADLVEEMEIAGTPRRSDVKRAQAAITELAQRLAAEGALVFPVGGAED